MTDRLTPAQIRQTEKNAAAEGFLHRVVVAADQDLNVDTGGLPDETISSRIRRISDAHSRRGWNPGVWVAKALNAGLNFVQRNHGQHAQASDLERALKVAATEQATLGLPGDALQLESTQTVSTHSREVSETQPQVTNSDR